VHHANGGSGASAPDEGGAELQNGAIMDKFTTDRPSVTDTLNMVESGTRKLQGLAKDSDDIFEQIAAMIEVIRVAQQAFTG